jgi:hypothetical protein
VEVAERYADGLATGEPLQTARDLPRAALGAIRDDSSEQRWHYL